METTGSRSLSYTPSLVAMIQIHTTESEFTQKSPNPIIEMKQKTAKNELCDDLAMDYTEKIMQCHTEALSLIFNLLP